MLFSSHFFKKKREWKSSTSYTTNCEWLIAEMRGVSEDYKINWKRVKWMRIFFISFHIEIPENSDLKKRRKRKSFLWLMKLWIEKLWLFIFSFVWNSFFSSFFLMRKIFFFSIIFYCKSTFVIKLKRKTLILTSDDDKNLSLIWKSLWINYFEINFQMILQSFCNYKKTLSLIFFFTTWSIKV